MDFFSSPLFFLRLYGMNNPSAQQLVWTRKREREKETETLKENYELNEADVDKRWTVLSFQIEFLFWGSIKSYRTETNPFLLIYHFPSCLTFIIINLSYTYNFLDIICRCYTVQQQQQQKDENNINFIFHFSSSSSTEKERKRAKEFVKSS